MRPFRRFPLAALAPLLGVWGAHAQGPAPAPPPAAAGPAGARPNIVLFLADDMGFSDIGGYGSEIRTPNLDRLARGGIRFTQFYNASRCCPTRASLLTGLYAHQAGVGHMTDNELATRGPGYEGRLNAHTCTLAEMLKAAGYSTYMVGKWHVSNGRDDKPDWPLQRGFDRFFGSLAGPEQYFDSPAMMWGNAFLPTLTGTYSTYVVSDTASAWIDRHVAEGRQNPFFLYVAHNAPHWPLQAPDSLVARYRGKYLKGWSALRRDRYARQLASGLIDSKWPLSADDGVGWDTLSAARKDEMDLRMAIYAAQVEALDQGIGTVLDALDRNGLRRKTLVLFLSDNGGNLEGGLLGGGPAADLGKRQTFRSLSYGQSWANASNTPFREYKHYEYEGGIATPLIASWPGVLADTNRWETQAGHVIDIMPTLAEAAGGAYPAALKGNAVYPMEGVSLLPALQGKPLARANALFWEHEGNRAVRDGKWKLVALKGKPWQLFDMIQDRSEQHDLAAARPALADSLAKTWNAWATRAHVFNEPVGLGYGERAARPDPRAAATGTAVRANGVRLPAGAAGRGGAAGGPAFRLPAED